MKPINPPTVQANKQSFSYKDRLYSFRYAYRGISFMLRTQHNAWIHLVLTITVCLSGWWLEVSATDWRWLIIAIVAVWAAEAINTAIENLCDVVSPKFHPGVAKAKDVAAGAVLICAIGAAIIGLLTFWSYLRIS